MKKCRKIRAHAYVHRRIRADGTCLRSERKIPTRTKRTRIVGSLSSNEFTGGPWEYQGYAERAGATIGRPYQELARIPFGNCGGVLSKPYCFNGIRRSRVTSLPSGRSTGSAGTKTPWTNRARIVREGFARAGASAGAGERLSRAVAGATPSAMRDCDLRIWARLRNPAPHSPARRRRGSV